MVVGYMSLVFSYLVFLHLPIINNYNKINMLKVYYNNLSIVITSKKEDGNQYLLSYGISNKNDIVVFISKLLNNEFTNDINLFGLDSNIIFRYLIGQFKYIEAAGGVVQNTKNEYLLIKRLGIWDLPKGKVEKNESVIEAAIREVCEETGLTSVEIINELPDTYHIYLRKGTWYLKKTYWFLMKNEIDENLVPQVDEDISEAIWMEKGDAHTAISVSYRSIKEGLGFVFDL